MSTTRHKDVQDPKMQGVTFYLSAFIKMLINDVSKYQKILKADTIESKAHDESSQVTKLILRPEK